MNGKIALEEHVSTKPNNTLWDSAGEADRNGAAYMSDVEAKLLDTDERIELMDTYGIETTILSLTSPGIQSILDTQQAAETARGNPTTRCSSAGTVAGSAAHLPGRNVTHTGNVPRHDHQAGPLPAHRLGVVSEPSVLSLLITRS
jgi:hypothetical protein